MINLMMWKDENYDIILLFDAKIKYIVSLWFIEYKKLLIITVGESCKAGLALSWLAVD